MREHFASSINQENLLAIDNNEKLKHAYIKTLENDAKFNEVMEPLANRLTEPIQIIQDTITLDQMLNIAVKFFFFK